MWKKIFWTCFGFLLFISASTDAAELKGSEQAGYQSLPAFQEAVERNGAKDKKERTTEEKMLTPSPDAVTEELNDSIPSEAEQEPQDVVAQEPAVPELTEEERAQAVLDSRKIVINLANCSLALYEEDQKVRLYPIALGKPSTPTPIGYYKIRSKDIDPTWIDPKDPEFSIPSGEENPLGYRWMEIWGNYGIHGTNRPDSIGKYVSNGCIRMWEKDVEALFDLVQIGTPVEITYNRIVVEKTPDDTVAYYIYPDNYDRQNVDVALVNEWLKGYGIQGFESDEAIEGKIRAADGEPTYIGKVYGIVLNGRRIPAKAIVKDRATYLPAMEIASEANIDLGWDAKRSMLVSAYGEVPGYDKKDYLYLSAEDAPKLFHLTGTLRPDKLYALEMLKEAPLVRPSEQQAPALSHRQREMQAPSNEQKSRTAGNRENASTVVTEQRESSSSAPGRKPILRHIDLEGGEE